MRAVTASVIKEMKLLSARRLPVNDDPLRLAQLALRRCSYLSTELFRLERRAPEASVMLARSIIETALIGAYLALSSAESADRLMKKQANPARRLRARFLRGDMLGALSLLPNVSFISNPLDPGLAAVRAAPDLAQIAKWLDQHPPFAPDGLATLMYEESYGLFSNHVEHPTPQTLERHASIPKRRLSKWSPYQQYRPPRLVPRMTLTHVALPAMASLCASLSRRLGRDPHDFDVWTSEVASSDGYRWSGSPARYAAATELVRMIGLSRMKADLAGAVVRLIYLSYPARSISETEQLMAASEILDRARNPLRLLSIMLPPGSTTRQRLVHWRSSEDQTPLIVSSSSIADAPQVLISALLLVYAGIWPDDVDFVEAAINRVAASADTTAVGALDRTTAVPPRLRGMRGRFWRQVDGMP